MKNGSAPFEKPSLIERSFNRIFGLLVRLGGGLPHNYLVEVRGRKSGHLHATPVDVLHYQGKRFLVAPRGYTQWVRNAQASGRAALRKGFRHEEFDLRPVPDDRKPAILKAYLDRFRMTVQRYFPVPAGSAPEAFIPLVSHYPVFELVARSGRKG